MAENGEMIVQREENDAILSFKSATFSAQWNCHKSWCHRGKYERNFRLDETKRENFLRRTFPPPLSFSNFISRSYGNQTKYKRTLPSHQDYKFL